MTLDVSVGVSQSSQPPMKVGPQGNYLNSSKVQPVSTKSRPSPYMATVPELNNSNHKGGGVSQRRVTTTKRLNELDAEHAQLKRQLSDIKYREKNAVYRITKIGKDLKNVEQDNMELQLFLTQLLQSKLQARKPTARD